MIDVSAATPPRRPDGPPAEVVPPSLRLPTVAVVRAGLVIWAVVLIVLLAVPELRSGERSWWIWVPVAALVVGGLGSLYVRRGRGNAADAQR